jgi:CYTH domain-containing protein
MEIEKKFVVRDLPAPQRLAEGEPIRQGYLAVGDNEEVRLRAKGALFFLTVKTGRGLVRGEYEVVLDATAFETLWPATEGRRLEKTRHRVPVAGGTAEVDVFGGTLSGLALVEVEFASVDEAQSFDPPPWFGAEVTEDDRYVNRSLACNGRPADR